MLYPAMNDLLKNVNNRYMLVNLTAKRARDIAATAEESETHLTEKPVKLALNDIMSGRIVLLEKNADEEAAEAGIDREEAAADQEEATAPEAGPNEE